jgi:hypothetical protein
MSDNLTDKKQGSFPLNVYSIQEITTIFSDIDQKIIELHECSSEDFLTLNAYFKKYYSDSKTISSNATGLFNLITNEERYKQFFKELKDFQVELQSLLSFYEDFIAQITNSMAQTILEMNQMFVTANNLKQDLMSLKLLVANLKLDVTISLSSDSKIGTKINDFNDLIIQTKSFFVEFYKRSNLFKESVKQLAEQLGLQRDRNFQHINDIIIEINFSSTLLDQTFHQAVELIPQLSESTKNTSESLAKIITNLQYQDIIRQKIDHIQQTHKDILKEVKEIEDLNTESVDVESQVKYFILIRDIAGLQAAQLIHTNKEYQKAIEAISSKFLEVGNDMTKIADLCHMLIGPRNGSSNTYLEEIREKLEKTGYFNEIFDKSIRFVKDKTKEQEVQLSSLTDNFIELSDFLLTIEKSIKKSLDRQNVLEAEQYENTTKQIRTILEEIQSINSLYNSQFEKIKGLCACTISNKENNPYEIIEQKLSTISVKSSKLIDYLYENNENVYKIIADNQTLSKRVSSDIKTSIEQIKYYDLFDKVIEEIIQKLNDINLKFQNFDFQSEEARVKHLEYIKARYTMESEHVIHDHLTQNDINIEELKSTNADEEDDNLELF